MAHDQRTDVGPGDEHVVFALVDLQSGSVEGCTGLTVSNFPVGRRAGFVDGKNDMFVAWTDVGSLVMGHYTPQGTYLYKLAKEFTLTDQFFMGALGAPTSTISGSPALAPPSTRMRRRPAADSTPPASQLAPESPKSRTRRPAIWSHDGSISPDGYVVNHGSAPLPAKCRSAGAGGDPRFADPASIRCGRRWSRPSATFCRERRRLGLVCARLDAALADRGVIYNIGGASISSRTTSHITTSPIRARHQSAPSVI